MGKHNAIQYLILSIILAAGAVILPTENCYGSVFYQVCDEYTYLGLSAPTAKILLGIVAVVLIAFSIYIFSRTKGDPLSASSRSRLRLAATTVLYPPDVLDVVRQVSGAAKGGGASLLTSGLQKLGAQVNVERESPDRLALSITSGNRLFELCTFSTHVAWSSSDGKTRLQVGGLETYKTNQTRLYMIIPMGPEGDRGIWPLQAVPQCCGLCAERTRPVGSDLDRSALCNLKGEKKMATYLGVVIVLVLLAAKVAQTLSVMFSRRYPRKQESPGRSEPPAG